MSNSKNLIQNKKRTPSERRENARKAGIASGRKRRQRKIMREYMNAILDHKVTDKKALQMLETMGIEEKTNRMLLVLGLFNKAAKGNVKAFKEIRNLLGEDKKSLDLGKIERIINTIDEIASQ